MPSRAKTVARQVARLPSIPKQLVDLFLTGPMTGEAINEAGAAFKKALIEASLNAELSHHLGYEAGAERPESVSNHRNGGTSKTVLSGDGKLRIETPRDRDGSFEPLLVPKHARRFTGFDDKIVALYARGLTVREIQGYLIETYGTRPTHQHGDAGRRRGDGVAEPAGEVSSGVFRRLAGQDQGRRGGAQQGRISGAWRLPRRRAQILGSGSRPPRAPSSG